MCSNWILSEREWQSEGIYVFWFFGVWLVKRRRRGGQPQAIKHAMVGSYKEFYERHPSWLCALAMSQWSWISSEKRLFFLKFILTSLLPLCPIRGEKCLRKKTARSTIYYTYIYSFLIDFFIFHFFYFWKGNDDGQQLLIKKKRVKSTIISKKNNEQVRKTCIV